MSAGNSFDRAVELLTAQLDADEAIGDWFQMTQERIDAFAAVTLDDQFIHTDPERAAQTVLGGTVAHGFLVLSLLGPLMGPSYDAVRELDGLEMALNYGLDRVRFIAPIPSDSRIRARSKTTHVEPLDAAIKVTIGVTVEVEGAEKPAMVADWIGLVRF